MYPPYFVFGEDSSNQTTVLKVAYSAMSRPITVSNMPIESYWLGLHQKIMNQYEKDVKKTEF